MHAKYTMQTFETERLHCGTRLTTAGEHPNAHACSRKAIVHEAIPVPS